jgi:carbamoyl-phosphate synthase large subunit
MGSICMRRELAAGNTYKAWVVTQPEVQAESLRVIAALGIRGPCNVQLRLTARGPVTFEINPRLSGTTAMRAHFGYNEVDMAIRSFLLGEQLQLPTITPGTALRFWDEMYPTG